MQSGNVEETPPKKKGRPLSFNKAEGLDRAIELFWRNGFTATSVADLTEHMGVSPPSIYGTFGNKHDLFMQCLDRYAETIGRRPLDAFTNEPDFRDAVRALFDTTVKCATSPERPSGCLMVSVAAEIAGHDTDVRKRMSQAYAERVSIVAGRVEAEQTAGRLSQIDNAETFAKMIVSVTHSLVTRARVGADPEEIKALSAGFLDLLLPA